MNCKKIFKVAASDLAFYNHGNALPTPDTQGCQAIMRLTPLHFIEQGYQDARTAGPDWMAQRNGTTVDVEFRAIEPELFPNCDRLCSKGLVGLHYIQIRYCQPGLLQRTPAGGHRPHAHNA